MDDLLLHHADTIRLAFFIGVFAVMAGWETIMPRRQRSFRRLQRWPSNIGIVALNTLILKVALPVAAVEFAATAGVRGWGLFPALDLPFWLEFLLAVAVLDFVIYLQHVLFHAVPVLWRLHRMHHADLDFDVTTGARFHPIEILLSMGIKFAAIAALGPPAVAVLVFEILLNGTAMFNHANARLPLGVDRWLRWLVVTPDMHRVHHSVVPHETNSNFGFNLPWWDRLFGTYRDQPAAGHDGMTIGLNRFRDPHELRLDHLLLQPWRSRADDYPINRRGGSD
ncbi:MAG: sterol desaturase family protein [Rhodospirillales bacterium]|nr:MAG: sterol desaturase family protein [Rhodospirillales bacterium]